MTLPPKAFSHALTGVVVGLGNIGQGYDYDCRDGSRILTHAQAFFHHPDFQLIGGVDPDPGNREKFSKKFAVPAHAALEDAVSKLKPDIWVVAVPTDHHLAVLEKVIVQQPRAVICEKPLAGSVEQARFMVNLAQANGTILLPNYIRRFEPGVRRLKQLLEAGEIGDVYKGVVWYSKGLHHNGSHFIDLLDFLLGPVTETDLLVSGREQGPGDSEPDVRIRFGPADVFFLAGREERFSLKDVELIGTKGRILYQRGGEKILVQKTQEQKLFPGYRVLQEPGQEIPTDLARYQWHVLEGLKRHLRDGEPLLSDGKSGLLVLETLDQIFRRKP